MAYELTNTGHGIEARIQGADRAEVFRDGVRAALHAAYGEPTVKPEASGQVVPFQVTGEDDSVLLERLLDSILEATQAHPSSLLPATWISFDENRLTVTIPESLASRAAACLHVKNVSPMKDAAGRLEIAAVFEESHGH